jgi:hypothetical protein
LYESCLFVLICVCTMREMFLASTVRAGRTMQFVHLLHGHNAWLEHIHNSRTEDMLGPLRIEDRGGRVCVVGLGQCHRVRNIPEGIQLITELKQQIANLFE